MLILFSMVQGLPWSIYSTFVIEEKYGFNKTTKWTFVSDKIKGFLIGNVMIALILPLILWIIQKAGPNLVIYLAGTSIALIVVLSLLVPNVIMPLFYSFSDLEEGKLSKAIYQESEKTSILDSQIKVIDGSTRSSHSNAFVSGFGSFRKVVIFDTLIEQQTHDEIIAVVNHELGHVHHSHIIKNVFMSAVTLTVMFFF